MQQRGDIYEPWFSRQLKQFLNGRPFFWIARYLLANCNISINMKHDLKKSKQCEIYRNYV